MREVLCVLPDRDFAGLDFPEEKQRTCESAKARDEKDDKDDKDDKDVKEVLEDGGARVERERVEMVERVCLEGDMAGLMMLLLLATYNNDDMDTYFKIGKSVFVTNNK